MKPAFCISRIPAAAAFAAVVSLTGLASAGEMPAPAKGPVLPPMDSANWLDHTISPVTNPIYFEDPAIRSEIRPIFMHHRIDDGFITAGGDVNLYALQIRYAVNDRLAIIATKDGYIDFNPGAGSDETGWADVALGLKYALIDDRANQFILTPGFTYEIPLGDSEVFQGNGDGEFDLFVSAAKGFGDVTATANTGVRLPLDSSAQSTLWHYSAQLSWYACDWFIPFVAANGLTVLDAGNSLPLNTEGYDLINFGSSASDGETQVTLGVGFRSNLTKDLQFGVAWEKSVTDPAGLFDDRLTVDLIYRF